MRPYPCLPRRSFLTKTAAATLAAPLVLPPRVFGANDRIVMGCIGMRGQGRAMVETARRYGRVMSGGSQRVWGDYNWFQRMVRGGRIGQAQEAWVNVGGPSEACYLEPVPTPAGVDWNRWLGPAPWRPFHPTLIAGGFRPYRDYSGGGMTDWGCHGFGGALFSLNLHETVRLAALEALGAVGDGAAVVPLLRVAAGGPAREAGLAQASLVRLAPAEANVALIQALRPGEPKLRVEACRALAKRRAKSCTTTSCIGAWDRGRIW